MSDVRSAIDAVQAEYAWALDAQAYDSLAELFTPDAVYTADRRRYVGAEAIRERFAARAGSPRVTRHTYSGLRLRAVAERSARATSVWVCYASNATPVPAGIPPLYMVADFDDAFTLCADGRWRIAERTITPVFRDPATAPGA